MHIRNAALFLLLVDASVVAQARWSSLDPLPARRGAAMTFDPLGRVLLFGGHTGGFATLQDQWSWDGVRWTELHPAQVPPARAEAGIASDLQRRRVILFGGAGQTGSLDDTWEWDGTNWNLALAGGTPSSPISHGNPLLAYDAIRSRTVLFENRLTYEWDGSTWTPMNPVTSPGAVLGASMTWHAVSGRAVLFGGDAGFGGLADTWTRDGINWRHESPPQSPPGRNWAGMTYDWTRGRAVVSCGRTHTNATTPPLNDAWDWDGVHWQPLVTSRQLPAREGVMLTFDLARGRLVQYGGGANVYDVQDDVWEHDGATWAQVQSGNLGPPATFTRAVYDWVRGRVLLHAADGSTWEHDGSSWLARQVPGPPPRLGFALAYDLVRNRTVLFGGGGVFAGQFNDTWEWDGATWMQRQTATMPSPRTYAAMAYDVGRQRTVLFGGFSQADTWEWDGNNWLQIAAAAGPTGGFRAMAYDARRQRCVLFGGAAAGETWEWDGSTWTLSAASAQPAPRGGYSLAYDALRDRTVMAGGSLPSGLTDEVWEWDGTAWRRQAGPAPSPRQHAAMTFDVARNQLVLHGGQFSVSWLAESWRCATDHPAAFIPFGAGCAASIGVPVLATAGGGLPWLGDTFGVGVEGIAGGTAAALCVGDNVITWGGVPLPASLAPGMPGCSAFLAPLAITDLRMAGNTTWNFPIPDAPLLVGMHLHCQGLVLDAAVPNPLRAAVSNAATLTLGVR